MGQTDTPLPPTLGTPAQRALIEPLFREYRAGGLTLHAAINAVVVLMQHREKPHAGIPSSG
jgi:hypothetical protein